MVTGMQVLHAASDAVVLMYHHVSGETPASTSVTVETFAAHMDYLASNKFHVWPLARVLNYLVNDTPLPEKTVVITFDDAYKSVYEAAFPELKKHQWPFTVFVTTQYIDTGYHNFMSWSQLQEVEQYGASIGNHTHSHPHLIRHDENESQQKWLQRVIGEIDRAQTILGQHIAKPLPVVAYPYGEYSTEIQALLKRAGYYGFGQHSGALGAWSNPYALPRYPMASGYDDMKNFAIKVNSRSLPVIATQPEDGVLSSHSGRAELHLKIADGDFLQSAITCYASGQGKIQTQWSANGTLTVQANQTLQPGRSKFNCTVPSRTETGIFYWYSFLWMKPEADGRWYTE